MLDAPFVDRSLQLSDRCPDDGEVSVRQTWVVREGSDAASWFDVRLTFADGARLEALAVLSRHGVRVEDVRARPPLSLDDLSVLAEWLEHPLFDACAPADAAPAASRRARPAWPGGREGRRLVAREYRAAREAGGTARTRRARPATAHRSGPETVCRRSAAAGTRQAAAPPSPPSATTAPTSPTAHP
ncbi:hypothetical protein GCM10010279_32790 [Streptomyces mutabilis]|nr:hypothetical protein GCM10010279_32790 [Streptomyces mutabilis]